MRTLSCAFVALLSLLVAQSVVGELQNFGHRSMTLHSKGLGPIEIGMSVQEVSALLGYDLAATGIGYVEEDCAYYGIGENRYDVEVGFLVFSDKIASIDVHVPGIPAAAGLEVGNPVGEVRAAFGERVEESPAHYGGTNLVVSIQGSEHKYLFYASKDRVSSIGVGIPEAVLATEGCM